MEVLQWTWLGPAWNGLSLHVLFSLQTVSSSHQRRSQFSERSAGKCLAVNAIPKRRSGSPISECRLAWLTSLRLPFPPHPSLIHLTHHSLLAGLLSSSIKSLLSALRASYNSSSSSTLSNAISFKWPDCRRRVRIATCESNSLACHPLYHKLPSCLPTLTSLLTTSSAAVARVLAVAPTAAWLPSLPPLEESRSPPRLPSPPRRRLTRPRLRPLPAKSSLADLYVKFPPKVNDASN